MIKWDLVFPSSIVRIHITLCEPDCPFKALILCRKAHSFDNPGCARSVPWILLSSKLLGHCLPDQIPDFALYCILLTSYCLLIYATRLEHHFQLVHAAAASLLHVIAHFSKTRSMERFSMSVSAVKPRRPFLLAR